MNVGSSIIGKTITIIILGLIAGIILYVGIRKYSNQLYTPLYAISDPIEKLKLVNRLYAEINKSSALYTKLNQSQNEQDLKNFRYQQQVLFAITDSIRNSYPEETEQYYLIDSVQRLLNQRTRRLIDFYTYRQSLLKTTKGQEEIDKLGELLAEDQTMTETVIVQDKETIKSIRLDTIEKATKKPSLVKRIFSKKQAPEIEIVAIEEEEIRESADTTVVVEEVKTEATTKAKEYLQGVRQSSQTKLQLVQKKSNELQAFENEFNEKVSRLIQVIENDLSEQAVLAKNGISESLQKSIRFAGIVFGVLLFASLFMLLQILRDVRKNNLNKRLLEEAKNEAEQQSRYKQIFLSNMSHELRTPLQSILGYTDQLKESPGNTHYIHAVQNASEHLLNVVNEVLEHSSLQSGKFRFEEVDFELGSVLKDIEILLKPKAEQKGLTFTIKHEAPSQDWLLGDPYLLKQILLNLLGNALKFTEKGSVSLAIRKDMQDGMNRYHFDIKDTGAGIPIAMQGKIFEQYEQVSPDMTMRRSGTGLGLAITRALIEGQRGEISFKSLPGKGTTFSFHLPYKKGTEKPESIETNKKTTSFKGQVWLVDDDKMILELCSIILKKHGILHQIFDSGEALLNATDAPQPVFIMMDIRMPGMSGLELCRALREKYGEDINLVAMTAQVLPEEKEEILKSGFNIILTKPFREAELLGMLVTKNKDNEVNAKTGTHNFTTENTLNEFLASLTEEESDIIIPQLIKESNADLLALKNGLLHADKVSLAEALHRLAGRLMQVGANDAGSAARKLEANIRYGHEDIPVNEIEMLIEKIEGLLEYLSNEKSG
jgi:signal transduction histidine kinase/FixJ family two-component response regulator